MPNKPDVSKAGIGTGQASEQVQLALPEAAPLRVASEVFVCFELAGQPIAKARPRARMVFPRSERSPFIGFYQPAETDNYELALGYAARAAMRGRPPTDRPLAVLLHCFLAVPVSWSTRKKNDALVGIILPTSRPDADNFLKIVDGMNSIVWRDDSQIVDARVIKRFSAKPALRVEVREYISSPK